MKMKIITNLMKMAYINLIIIVDTNNSMMKNQVKRFILMKIKMQMN